MTGVFIPTEMPQKCYECFYGHDCELVNPYYVEEQRPVDCPLISVADVVEVVRCKDCTRQTICYHSDDYFCADGERREDAEAVNTKN